MNSVVPRIQSMTAFKSIGFYDYMHLGECILKAMRGNLITNPKMPRQIPTRQSIVGLFHHHVMELVFKATSISGLSNSIEDEIKSTQKIIDTWAHLNKSGSVSGWEEINTSATLALRLFRDIDRTYGEGRLGLEDNLFSSDGLLVGRPDFFYVRDNQAVLRELKSSSLRDENRDVRRDYLEQLKFYSLLLFDTFSVVKVDAILESSNGEHISFCYTPDQVDDLRKTARQLISDVNAKIAKSKTPEDLTVPKAASCSGCDNRIVCEAFKSKQLTLGLKGDVFVLDGHVEGRQLRGAGQAVDLNIRETLSGETRMLTVPIASGNDIKAGKRYLISDLGFQAGKFRWSDRTRFFSYE